MTRRGINLAFPLTGRVSILWSLILWLFGREQ
jgi:hypothetical protein